MIRFRITRRALASAPARFAAAAPSRAAAIVPSGGAAVAPSTGCAIAPPGVAPLARSGIAALALCALFAAGAARAELSDVERRIVDAVRARTPHALELLERTVRINSGTLNVAGVREVGAVYRSELEALGFSVRWADMPPEMNRAGHLVATQAADPAYKGPRLLLLGHMDTVFEKASPVAAWERRGERVRGQGVSDMKGGNVILLEGLRALHAFGQLDGAAVTVLLTGDEERVGSPLERARAALVEAAKASDAALSFEGGGPRGEASITRRSSGSWTLTVKAKPGHSAGIFSPQSGYGAVFEAARILNAFREQLIEPNVTFNPGVVVGGTQVDYSDATAAGNAFGKTNVIAKDFVVRGDLRYLTPEQGERTKQKMRDIVAASLPGASATIAFRDGYPPMPPSDGGRKLIATLSQASQDAGFGPAEAMDPARRGAGDVQFAAPYIAGIDGLGARGSGSHTDDEDLEIASIERNAIRAAIFMQRLIHSPWP